MRRRDFIKAIASSATVWPLAGRAQPAEQAHRIGVLMGFREGDPIVESWLNAFRLGLTEVGWKIGRNLQIEYRWTAGSIERAREASVELVSLKPDLIFASTTPITAALKRATTTIPIIFVQVSDPVGAGFVASLPRPGANITGFIDFEDTMGGKWLELLKEASPALTRVIALFNPETAPGRGSYFLPSFEAAGRKLGVIIKAAPVHNPEEINGAITALAARPGGGVVDVSDSFMLIHFGLVMKLTEAYKLPAIYGFSVRAHEGALMSYAPDIADMYAKAVSYVDRVLKGESPASLPVQVPTKFELMINLKTAKSIGVTVPPSLLARAEEVIE